MIPDSAFALSATEPYGNPTRASILVIGHDPTLQRSRAEARKAFFLDYLHGSKPTAPSEMRKYGLALKLQEYISWLAGYLVPLESLYVTNLCNQFLQHSPGSGTVLIPDDLAEQGMAEISQAISQGHFQVIIPMSQQVNYHLARLGFFDEKTMLVQEFIQAAQPKPDQVKKKIYTYAGKAPFLKICGQRFHHHGTPVVPVLHVKQWSVPLWSPKYEEPMSRAAQEVKTALSNPAHQ